MRERENMLMGVDSGKGRENLKPTVLSIEPDSRLHPTTPEVTTGAEIKSDIQLTEPPRCPKIFLFFLVQVFIAINFPFRAVLAASHKFWYIVFLFSFTSRYF